MRDAEIRLAQEEGEQFGDDVEILPAYNIGDRKPLSQRFLNANERLQHRRDPAASMKQLLDGQQQQGAQPRPNTRAQFGRPQFPRDSQQSFRPGSDANRERRFADRGPRAPPGRQQDRPSADPRQRGERRQLTAEEKKKIQCRFFLTARGCKKGDKCDFAHVKRGEARVHCVATEEEQPEQESEADNDDFEDLLDSEEAASEFVGAARQSTEQSFSGAGSEGWNHTYDCGRDEWQDRLDDEMMREADQEKRDGRVYSTSSSSSGTLNRQIRF